MLILEIEQKKRNLITEQRTYKLWESASHKIVEAQLTADQIKQLFANIEQGATAAGNNRTMIGKGKDAAGAVSKAWGDLKNKVYNSGPMNNFAAAYDKQAEKLKQATGGDQGVFKYVQKYRNFAEKHPIIQGFVYSALIAAAGITGAGLGGAAVLGLFKLTDQLLQGKDIRSAIYQGAKTGALAYGASKLGDLIRGEKSISSGEPTNTNSAAAAPAPAITPDSISNGITFNGSALFDKDEIIRVAVDAAKSSGGDDWAIKDNVMNYLMSQPQFASTGNLGTFTDNINNLIDAGLQGKGSLAGIAKAATMESVILTTAQVTLLTEGVADKIKQVGKNITTKITADKLLSAWKKAGSPTDSNEVYQVLRNAGISDEVMKPVFKSMSIPFIAGAPRNVQPAPTNTGSSAMAMRTPKTSPAYTQVIRTIDKLTPDQAKEIVAYIDSLGNKTS